MNFLPFFCFIELNIIQEQGGVGYKEGGGEEKGGEKEKKEKEGIKTNEKKEEEKKEEEKKERKKEEEKEEEKKKTKEKEKTQGRVTERLTRVTNAFVFIHVIAFRTATFIGTISVGTATDFIAIVGVGETFVDVCRKDGDSGKFYFFIGHKGLNIEGKKMYKQGQGGQSVRSIPVCN